MSWFISFVLVCIVSAEPASKRILAPVWRMIKSKLAFARSQAWLYDIAACSLMAKLTEMSGTEAEPECYLAAVSTFELDRIFSMRFTLADSNTSSLSCTGSTNKVFLLELLLILLLTTFPLSTIVGVAASEAHVEGKSL